MPTNSLEYRGFITSYDRQVDKLVSKVNIIPIASADRMLQNMPIEPLFKITATCSFLSSNGILIQ